MPPVDIAPLMNHPAWGKTLSPDQRKQALELWQDAATSDSDRTQMLGIMDQWQSAPVAQPPAPPQQPPAPSRLEEIEAELARREGQAATQQAPTAGGWQADIFGTPPQAPAAQPPAEEPITFERRFLDLPSVQQLPLEERTQRFKEFYGLRPALKEEFLRSEEPPSDLVIDIEKPSPPAPPGAAPQTPRAATGPAPAPGQPGWAAGMIEPLTNVVGQAVEAEINRPAPLPVPPEAAIAAVPGMAGYAIGARLAPLLGPVGKVVPPLLEAAGGYLGRRTNVKLGYEEEGPGGDVLSLLPLATRSLGSATAGWLERTVKEVPAPARNELLGALMQLFKRGGAPATLTYALSSDPQLAAWVGGSTAVARSLLEFGLRHPAGKQLVEQTLKAGRAIGGEELGMLMNIGRTGHTATPHSAHAREGKVPVALAPLMDHPAWKGKLKTDQQRRQALDLWQDPASTDSDRAEMFKIMDQWQAAP